MRFRGAMMLVAGGTALWAVPALAQGRPLPLPKPPAHSQQASAGPATPPPQTVTQQQETNYGPYRRSRVQMVRYAAQVSVDGRVYANFGNGLSLVQAECSAQQIGVAPAQQQAYGQPQVTQPVPQVQSVTAQAMAQNPGSGGSTVSAYPSACWTRAANGAVEVYR